MSKRKLQFSLLRSLEKADFVETILIFNSLIIQTRQSKLITLEYTHYNSKLYDLHDPTNEFYIVLMDTSYILYLI